MLNHLAVFVRLDAWLSMLRYGRGVELRWGNLAGRVVEELLHTYGIPTYDQRVHPRGVRSVRVPASQARWAEYLCKRRGIALHSAIDPANRNVKPGPLPPDWGRPAPWAGFTGLVFGMFGARTTHGQGKRRR